jgi:hypothetical protein
MLADSTQGGGNNLIDVKEADLSKIEVGINKHSTAHYIRSCILCRIIPWAAEIKSFFSGGQHQQTS